MDIAFSSVRDSCFLLCSISIKNAASFYEFIKMIMDSPGRHAGRQQGETMAVGTDGGERRSGREGHGEQGEGGWVEWRVLLYC